MTDNIARRPKGTPSGGQFAPDTHAEPDFSLAPARRPELEGWPESLPEPEVGFSFDEDYGLTTHVEIRGHGTVNAWTRGRGNYGWESDAIGCVDLDEDACEQAQEWAKAAHRKIEARVRDAQDAAAERVRASAVAVVTGAAPEATDAQLATFIEAAAGERNAADRDMELASAGLAARKILVSFPDAVGAEIRTDSWENGDFVAGAIVRDAAGNRLAECFEDSDDESHKEIVGLLKNLAPVPQNSHWAGAFSTGYYGEDLYTIDLRKAAEWKPGTAQ